MPRTVNKVILLGSAGKDPEVRYAASGTAFASFTLATNERYKDKSGEWQERTEWHSLTAFSRTAEVVRDYVKKGSKLYIEGKLQTRSWDDKQSGQKRYRTEIVVDELVLLSGTGERHEAPAAQSHASEPDAAEIDDDSIPF